MLYDNNSIPESLLNEYQLHIRNEGIRSTRVMCILSLLLYLSFIVVDFYALPSAIFDALIIRAVVITGLLISFCLTFTKVFQKMYQLIQVAPFFIAGIGINLMILISQASDKASDIYFAGLILVIMVLFSWSHVKLNILFCTAISIIGMYIYIELSKATNISLISPALVSNTFFLTSAAIIGFVTQIMRDQYLRQNFYLQRSLEEAYDAKSLEAKDNEYLANHDPLTDLPNRRHLTDLLNNSLEIAATEEKVLVVMFIDLNGFKQINDVYGHNAGDEVLVIVAKRLELAIRDGDHISRIGGDEYVMGLMMEKENLDEIETMANKFIDIISQPMNVDGLRVKVGASIGVAAYPIHGNSIEALIEVADQRMYQAKKRKHEYNYAEDLTDEENKQAVVIFPGNAKKR